MESELQTLCASILHKTFPEVCITDAVIPDPCETPTALQWRDPNSKTFLPSSQIVPISLATMHQDLCTINMPYGLYRYRVLPLGIMQSPDFCQKTMEHVLQGILDADVYIDDIGCFGKSWEQHLQVLEQVVTHLQENSFSVNPCKCEWAVQETDFQGYWLTPNRLEPWHKKIDTILRLQCPRTVDTIPTRNG